MGLCIVRFDVLTKVLCSTFVLFRGLVCIQNAEWPKDSAQKNSKCCR